MKRINLAKAFLKSRDGVVAIIFGLLVPVVVSAVGTSVDVAQMYLVRERLSHALDAAALAAAASPSDDPKVIEKKVNDFVNVNYPPGKVGFTVAVHVDPGKDVLNVNATARLDTSFMKVVGIDTVDVYVETEVHREVKAIEVALVTDVTGSMSTNNNIGALITAAKNFVNIMFDRTDDKSFIKIALVPFSTSVNVGMYGLGKNPDGSTYDTSFISNPNKIAYTSGLTTPYAPYKAPGYNPDTAANKLLWKGCILENAYPTDTEDSAGPFKPYRYCRDSSDKVVKNCDTTNANKDANYICPKTPILPLTNNQQDLLNAIGQLKAEGSTYVNVGLVWGLRVLSPEFPFREGVAWNNPNWKKAVILMTDGDNQANSYYSVYGLSSGAGITNTKLNNRVLDVCDELKSKGVLVYTITFYSEISQATKDIYKQCATQPSMWYDAPTQQKLIDVYGTIAKELSNLRISK